MAAASPQVVATAAGIAADDPFLSYRVASNRDLGVELLPGVVGSGALLLPLLALLAAGVFWRRPLWVAYPLGAATTWVLLATNDRWGPNAEPYRLWIDSFVLVGAGLLPLFVYAATELMAPPRPPAPEEPGAPLRDGPDQRGALRPVRPAVRRVAAGVVALVVAVGTVSAVDWVRFVRADDIHDVFDFANSRSQAHAAMVSRAPGDALIAVDTCIDPQIVKLNSAANVAFYNLGMAWPRQRDEVQAYLAERAEGRYSIRTLADAGIGVVLTDTACGDDWRTQLAAEAELAGSTRYDGGRVDLWSLPEEAARSDDG